MFVMVTAVSAQVSLGVKGGINMSNFYGDELDTKNVKVGFNIGLLADYEFTYNSAIQTGLFFTSKGSKYTTSLGSISGEISSNPMYLQLPIHYAYKLDVTPGTRIVFHGGPYAAFGVGGKWKVSGSYRDNTAAKDGSLFGSNALLKRFDAGLGLGVGAEFGVILVDLGWDMGLVNISESNKGDLKNQNAYVSVGYKF